MAKNKGTWGFIELDYHAMEKMKQRYEKAGANYQKAAEQALLKSKTFIANKLEKDTVAPNFPAKGKYGSGADLREAIIRTGNVGWSGMTAKTGAGFRLSRSLVPQFLMYGTPKMKPAKKMREDVFGRNTGRQLREIQEEVMFDFLEECIEGKA